MAKTVKTAYLSEDTSDFRIQSVQVIKTDAS